MLRDTSGGYASLLVSLYCKVATQQLRSTSVQLSCSSSSVDDLVGCCRIRLNTYWSSHPSVAKPLPKLKVPIHFVEIFFPPLCGGMGGGGALPLLPFKPTSKPRTYSHCACVYVCVVSKVWVRDPYRGSEVPNFTNINCIQLFQASFNP